MKKRLASTVIIALALTAGVSITVDAEEAQVNRIGEADRYATAASVATTNWVNNKNVILVCGEGYADAVSASVLAKQLDAPILLTEAKSLNKVTENALEKLKPSNVYVIGGNASVSKEVRNKLKDDNYNLIELSGENRYETNVEVAKELIKLGIKADNVMLVGGEGFSDALSVASVAAAKGQILLLGNNSEEGMKPIFDFVKSYNSKVSVIGTSNVIDNNIYNMLKAVERIQGGKDRFETNLNVLKRFSDDLKSEKVFIANASGNGYADALVASALAGKWSSNLVLLDNEKASATDKAIAYIKDKKTENTDLTIIGGKGVISDEIVYKINNKTEVKEPTVKSVIANGLNQIKVEFNTEVDEDTAELLRNYQIDGNDISSSSASATLQEDKRTVLITLSDAFKQNDTAKIKVKNAILDNTLSNNIEEFEKKITFFDVEWPTLQSVTPVGGNKLVVKFSKPIRMDKEDLSSMKINRQSVSNYGLNTSMCVFYNSAGEWSDKVELYFDTTLPIGNNMFSIQEGEVNKKFDTPAGFPVMSSNAKFSIEQVSGTPKVVKVNSEGMNKLYITYDRAMDKQTALEDSNYRINGSTVSVNSDDISFVDGSNDKIVEIEGIDYLIENGENKVTIKDSVKDTYGNEIEETSLNFNTKNDFIKPEVTNVTIIDKNTIRVKFNKDVSRNYATDEHNYKLQDSSGNDISYKIDDVISTSSSSADYKNTYFIKFKDENRLTDSKYILTVKNIIDTNDKPNIMDPCTKIITNSNNSGPTVTEIVKKEDDDQSVVVFFNKSMDRDSILNISNYYIIEGNGQSGKLPSDCKIYGSSDDKSVTIEFPSNYTIDDERYEDHIRKIGVADVKDKEGNTSVGICYADKISTNYGDGPELIDGSAKLTYDGKDIKVTLSLTAPLDILNINDFRIAGEKPDTGIVSGNEVTLVYKHGIKNNEKIESIEDSKDSTTINISNPKSVDIAGRKLQSASDTLVLPPRTDMDEWTARGGYISSVTIVFNQDIDDEIEKSYNDDFVFINERTGKNLNVNSVIVDGKTVLYRFDNNSMEVGDKIIVKASQYKSNISIRSEYSNNGYNGVYSPSIDDLNGKTITIK